MHSNSIFHRFSIWFKTLLQELANTILSVVFILIIYLILWYFPQTVDLLLMLNQTSAFLREVPFYFILLVVASLLIWNTPKYYYYQNYKDITLKNVIGFVPTRHYRVQKDNARDYDLLSYRNYAYATKLHMRKVLPRILGVLVHVIASMAILNAMQLFQLQNIFTTYLNAGWVVLLLLFFLLLLTEPQWYEKIKRKLVAIPRSKYFIGALIAGLLILIIALGTFNTQTEKDLGKLFIASNALGLLFFILAFNSRYLLYRVSKPIFYGSILLTGIVIFIVFLGLNFAPLTASCINPLSIVLMSLVSLYMVAFTLILLGKKVKLPLLTLVVLICFGLSRYFAGLNSFSHYQLPLVDTHIERLPIEVYVEEWIKRRESAIQNAKKPYPVILVSAEGGGSRAGLWSFLIHSYLYEKTKGSYFNNHILSLTGASGGSVGNGMFFAEARRQQLQSKIASFRHTPTPREPFSYKPSGVYHENFLSSSLLAFLGRDLLKNMTNLFSFRDRGVLLEDQWSQSYSNYISEDEGVSLLKKDFLSNYLHIPTSYQNEETSIPPLLFINTTHTQTGKYVSVSPVTFDHRKEFAGIGDFLTSVQQKYPGKSVRLSTAMRINASFPFVSPVGEVRKVDLEGTLRADQYADSGYYDNIGGTVTRSIEAVFQNVIETQFPYLKDRIKVVRLLITNDNGLEVTRTETQLSAPLATLLNVQFGHTDEVIEKLGNHYTMKLRPVAVYPARRTESSKMVRENDTMIKPLLPLGRYLSTIAIRSIEKRLEQIKPQLDTIIPKDLY